MPFLIFVIVELGIVSLLAAYLIAPLFGAPYVRSGRDEIEDFLKIAKLKKTDFVVDLGSGTGTVVERIAKQGFRVEGIEINPFFVAYSNIKFRVLGLSELANVRWGNIKTVDLSKYNVVYCYLMPGIMNDLQSKFKSELVKGTKVISSTFQMKEMNPAKIFNKMKLYIF